MDVFYSRRLCEDLCSLNPDEERLTFSVEWVMNENGDILAEEWFGRTVIKSCCKLAYEHAQSMIEHAQKNIEEVRIQILPKEICNTFLTKHTLIGIER